jgi:hypothetical protein
MIANRFNNYVLSAQQCLPPLPLTHTCDTLGFRNIATACQISTVQCKVFDEALVYFFYGRPAYRPKSWKKKTARAVLSFMPCSIVLEPDALDLAKRIAPFDTGAWKEGLFKQYMHPEMNMEDFLLTPSMDIPPRVVEAFFGSNHNYYYATPHSISIPPIEFEAQSYYELIQHRATLDLDDRASAIEIQSDQSLLLTDDKVLYVVLPKVFYDEQAIRETITIEWKAPVTLYQIQAGTLSEHKGIVDRAVGEFLSKAGYI